MFEPEVKVIEEIDKEYKKSKRIAAIKTWMGVAGFLVTLYVDGFMEVIIMMGAVYLFGNGLMNLAGFTLSDQFHFFPRHDDESSAD